MTVTIQRAKRPCPNRMSMNRCIFCTEIPLTQHWREPVYPAPAHQVHLPKQCPVPSASYSQRSVPTGHALMLCECVGWADPTPGYCQPEMNSGVVHVEVIWNSGTSHIVDMKLHRCGRKLHLVVPRIAGGSSSFRSGRSSFEPERNPWARMHRRHATLPDWSVSAYSRPMMNFS